MISCLLLFCFVFSYVIVDFVYKHLGIFCEFAIIFPSPSLDIYFFRARRKSVMVFRVKDAERDASRKFFFFFVGA